MSDAKHTWITKGLKDEYGDLLPLGTQEAKAGEGNAVFMSYSRGAETTRDVWVYNFDELSLQANVESLIDVYNVEVDRWHNRTDKNANLDDFVLNDSRKIKWSSRLKECLMRNQYAAFEKKKIRKSLYRPYTSELLFFDSILTHRQGQFPKIFPLRDANNSVICMNGIGMSKPFHTIMVSVIPDVQFTPNGQCFPFYTYDEDGSNRKENITDWALKEFRVHYNDKKITKWDIFYYVYGLLHHQKYGENYQANLKRELPRIPFTPDFWGFSKAGKKLAELHANYEKQEEYPLEVIENKDEPLNWRVEKMKLSKDKTQLIYNNFLTLDGIPPDVFGYRLGNRSALDWIVDQYQVKTDKRSGIVNDPNREDEPDYIVKLIKKVVTISLETNKIVRALPALSVE